MWSYELFERKCGRGPWRGYIEGQIRYRSRESTYQIDELVWERICTRHGLVRLLVLRRSSGARNAGNVMCSLEVDDGKKIVFSVYYKTILNVSLGAFSLVL